MPVSRTSAQFKQGPAEFPWLKNHPRVFENIPDFIQNKSIHIIILATLISENEIIHFCIFAINE